jgi:hypothetical protein
MTHQPHEPARRNPGPMTREEARWTCEEVKSRQESCRRMLLELYRRQGWKALGYASWRECCQEEFRYGQSRVYQLLEAAQIEEAISTRVEKPVPEFTLRQMAPLRNDPSAMQKVWDDAVRDQDGNAPAAGRLAELVARERALALSRDKRAELLRQEEEALRRCRAEMEEREEAEDWAEAKTRLVTRTRQALAIARRMRSAPAPARPGNLLLGVTHLEEALSIFGGAG